MQGQMVSWAYNPNQVHPRFCINGCALEFQERQGAAAAPTE